MRPTRVVPAIVLCLACLGLTVSLLPAYSQGRYAAFLPLLQREYRRPRLLAFAGDSGHLSVIASDGSGLSSIYPSSSWDPAWSPDGARIAFTAQTSAGTRVVHVVNRDGTGLIVYDHSQGRNASGPRWSPDGTRLLYTTYS